MIAQKVATTTAFKMIEAPMGMVVVVTAMSASCISVGGGSTSTARLFIIQAEDAAATPIPLNTNRIWSRALALNALARPLNELTSGTSYTVEGAVEQLWELEGGASLWCSASEVDSVVFTASFYIRQQLSRSGAATRR